MALGLLLTAVGIAFTVLYLVNNYLLPEEDKIKPTSTTLAATIGTHLHLNFTTTATLAPTTTSTTIETTTPTEITETITLPEAIEAITTETMTTKSTTTSETTTMNATPPEKIDTTPTTVREQMASTTTPTLPPWMKGETTRGITTPDDYKEEP